jgi:hypothetical protein
VLHQARQVAEAEVDDLDSLLLDDAQYFSRGPFGHISSSVISVRGGAGATPLPPPPSRWRHAVSRLLPDC